MITTIVPKLGEPQTELKKGMILSLKQEPDNEVDPNAVQAFLGDEFVGYVANSNKTILPGRAAGAKISKNLQKQEVAGAYVKLQTSHEYTAANNKTQIHWDGEVYWLPVLKRATEKEENSMELTVGGSRVMNQDLPAVIEKITNRSLHLGDLLLTADNVRGKTHLVVWRSKAYAERGANPAGEIKDAPQELINRIVKEKQISVSAGEVLSPGTYTIKVSMEKAAKIETFYDQFEALIKNCVMQARDIRERAEYLLEQRVPDNIIREMLSKIQPDRPGCQIPRPQQLFLQENKEYLTRAIAYYLSGKSIRLIGEKGAGKNTLIYSICWLLNKPVCRIQGNADLDKVDLLGGQGLKNNETFFEPSEFLQSLQRGDDVVLDEVNAIKPEIAIALNSLTDDARAIDVPGYGTVNVHPDARIWATMNEAYIGTGELNSALADRFVPLYLEEQINLTTLLEKRVPTAKKEDIAICNTIYEKILKAVQDGACTIEAITTRGYIDALEATKWLPLRTTLLDNVANRSQDEQDRAVVREFIQTLVD